MEKRDTQWIAAFLVLGALGLWTFLNNYDTAIPVASLDFKLSREEAFAEARTFAASQGHDLTDFDSAQIFAPKMMSQIFLQKSVGLAETNRLAKDWVSVFSWKVRWYKPLEKEEVHVHLDPGGRVVYYSHRILDEAEGARLAQDEAESTAESFAFSTMGFDRGEWESVEKSSEERTSRTDHTFTYRKNGFVVGDDGHYRVRVVVKGASVGGFDEFLFVPETFKRDFQETRSRAGLLTNSFGVFWAGLALSVLIILAQRYRAGGLQWRSSIMLGVAVLGAMMLAQLNAIPLIQFGYNTTQSMGSFYLLIVMRVVMASILTGSIVAMAGTAGGWVARDVFGDSHLYPRISLRSFVSARFVRATLIGYGLAGMMLGFLILFYYVGTELFGVWSPAYVIEYDNAFSTAFPWAYPLLVGLVAATQEEFFFRLLAISLLMRWLKIRWLAVLIPAIVWGFLHSNYPVEPIYTRGIELTIVGTAFGYVFLRWGVWSTIVAHYAYNAFVTAFPMLKSSSLYFQISGIAVIGLLCLPVIAAAVSAIRGRAGEEESIEDPESAAPTVAEKAVETPAVDEASVSTTPISSYVLSSNQRWLSIGICLVGFGLGWLNEVPRFGRDTYNLTVDRSEAFRLADGIRKGLGWELEAANHYVDYRDDLGHDAFTYLIRKVGIGRADSLIDVSLFPRRWETRWFRPLEKTEFRVDVSESGELASFRRLLPDGLAGAELTGPEAQRIAATSLRDHFSIDVTDTLAFRRLEAKTDKKENRLDHTFVWERITTKVDSGEFRVNAVVQGDQIGEAYLSFKAPESFLRELREKSLKDTILSTIPVVFFLLIIVLTSVAFFKLYRAGAIAWRVPMVVAAVVVSGGLVSRLNELPLFFQGFRTSQTMMTFLGGKAISSVSALVFGFLTMAVIAALALSLFRQHIVGAPGPVEWFKEITSGRLNGWLIVDSYIMAAAIGAIGKGFGVIGSRIDQLFPEHFKARGHSMASLDTYSPFVKALADTLFGLLLGFAIIAFILILKRYLKEWKWVIALVIAMLLFPQLRAAQSFGHGAATVALILVHLSGSIGYIVRVVRLNLLAYAFLFLFWPKVSQGFRMMDSSLFWYDANGAGMILLGLLPLLVGIYYVARGNKKSVVQEV